MAAGGLILVTAPGGAQYEAVVPDGVASGDEIEVWVDTTPTPRSEDGSEALTLSPTPARTPPQTPDRSPRSPTEEATPPTPAGRGSA